LLRAYSEDDRIIYVWVQPPLISERENLVRYTRKDIGNGKTLVYLRSVLDDEISLKPNVVRMEMMKIQELEQVGEDLKLVDVTYMDMKGYIPASLMNMAMTTMISKGIASIYKAQL